MPPLKRKLVISTEISKPSEKQSSDIAISGTSKQFSEKTEEDWLSELKNDNDSSDDERLDSEESDHENDPGPVFDGDSDESEEIDDDDDDDEDEDEDGDGDGEDEDEDEDEDKEDEDGNGSATDGDDEAEAEVEAKAEAEAKAKVINSDKVSSQKKMKNKLDKLGDSKGIKNKIQEMNLNDVNSKEETNISNKSKTVNTNSSSKKSSAHQSKGESSKQQQTKSIKNVFVTIKDDSSKNNVDNLKSSKTADEYEHDTSDEEDIRNTVGNIPMNWYDEYPHLGYDWDGKKILKPEKRDQLDEFLRRMEDPDFWRTVKDSQTGQNVVLSDADVELIDRMQRGKIPDKEFQEYAPWVEWFSSQVMKTPLRNFPEHKRSFLPSKTEKDKVSKLVHALKMGWIKPEAEKEKERQQAKEKKFYMLWGSDDQAEHMRRIHNHIPAPKRLLPGHAESYNPPPEYLFDQKELKDWNKQASAPWRRKLHYIPQKFKSLREVPAYGNFIQERFQRCLDLYLCPRGRKMKLTIEPEDLVPQLPSPKDLQPFPTVMSLVFKGHTDMVRTISIDLKGQYLVSGSDDLTIKVWEVSTGRCLKTIGCGGIVRSVSWCPSQAISLILVAADRKVLLINPGVGDSLVTSKTDILLEEAPKEDLIVSDRVKTAVQWEQPNPFSEEWLRGIRIVINHFQEVRQVAWHGRCDYFSTVMPEGANRSVLIHQLSKRRSQVPFSKSKGLIQCVLFHPVKPYLFVATQRNIRIYDLVKQDLVKKLLSNSRWISSMAIHPGGDNVLVGTYDRKMVWFDLDLSTKPYQTLRLHGTAVRGVAFHKRYPLFASGSDDRGLIVSHGMVYNDFLKNPLIVPLKRHLNHESNNDFGIFDVLFHPTQPWVFSCGADGTIRLYT